MFYQNTYQLYGNENKDFFKLEYKGESIYGISNWYAKEILKINNENIYLNQENKSLNDLVYLLKNDKEALKEYAKNIEIESNKAILKEKLEANKIRIVGFVVGGVGITVGIGCTVLGIMFLVKNL